MKIYLFNYMATVQVEAETEDEARESFWLVTDRTNGSPVANIIDSDVMLVETICLHDGIEDASDCECRYGGPEMLS